MKFHNIDQTNVKQPLELIALSDLEGTGATKAKKKQKKRVEKKIHNSNPILVILRL